MLELLANPVQVVGWLFILLLVGVLFWLVMTRKSQGVIVPDSMQAEDERDVVEGSLEQDQTEKEP